MFLVYESVVAVHLFGRDYPGGSMEKDRTGGEEVMKSRRLVLTYILHGKHGWSGS